jgi:hypothetical protein
MKLVPDLISNVQYAIRTSSRLVLAAESPIRVEVAEELAKKEIEVASVTLDLKGLLREFPEIEEAILGASLPHISSAFQKSKRKVNAAWEQLSLRDEDSARKTFEEGLRIFLEAILGKKPQSDLPGLVVNVVHRAVPEAVLEFAIELPILKWITFSHWRKKWKLKGLDRFINIRKAPK